MNNIHIFNSKDNIYICRLSTSVITATLPDCLSCYPGCTAVCPAPHVPWRRVDSIFAVLQDQRLAVFVQSPDIGPEVNKSVGIK